MDKWRFYDVQERGSVLQLIEYALASMCLNNKAQTLLSYGDYTQNTTNKSDISRFEIQVLGSRNAPERCDASLRTCIFYVGHDDQESGS